MIHQDKPPEEKRSKPLTPTIISALIALAFIAAAMFFLIDSIPSQVSKGVPPPFPARSVPAKLNVIQGEGYDCVQVLRGLAILHTQCFEVDQR